jgi:hypothetical protein
MDDEDGEHLAQILSVLRKTEAWAARISATSERLRAAPDSPLRGDDARTHPYDLSHAVWRHLSNSVDHLTCMHAVLGKASLVPMYAPFTLVRGALENACAAIWLLQPASRRERLIRRFRLAISDIHHEYQAGELMGQAEPHARQKPIAEVVAIAERADIGGASVRKTVSYTEIVAEVDKDFPGSTILVSWKTCSGFAHGDWWTTKSASRRTQIPGPDLEGIGTYKIEANLSLLKNMTAIAVAQTRRGWDLHDRQSRSPHARPDATVRPTVPEAFRRSPRTPARAPDRSPAG